MYYHNMVQSLFSSIAESYHNFKYYGLENLAIIDWPVYMPLDHSKIKDNKHLNDESDECMKPSEIVPGILVLISYAIETDNESDSFGYYVLK